MENLPRYPGTYDSKVIPEPGNNCRAREEPLTERTIRSIPLERRGQCYVQLVPFSMLNWYGVFPGNTGVVNNIVLIQDYGSLWKCRNLPSKICQMRC